MNRLFATALLSATFAALLGAAPGPGIDYAAMFRHAVSLEAAGDSEGAIAEFTRVAAEPTAGHWQTDAYLHIGELYFGVPDLHRAAEAYAKAAEGADGDKDSFASYKLAWCAYLLKDPAGAVTQMKAVVASPRTSAKVHDEALADLVVFFAAAGDVDAANTYFKSVGKPALAHDTAVRQAAMFMEQAAYEPAAAAYRALIVAAPNDPQAPEFQAEVLNAMWKLGRVELVEGEARVLVKDYGPYSAWAKVNKADAHALASTRDLIERQLRTVATGLHIEAQKIRTGPGAIARFDAADHLYSRYLEEFPHSASEADMRYSHAELLYKRKKFDLAYEEYMVVVAIDAHGKHAEFCAESAIFAADEMMKVEKLPVSAPGETTPIPLGPWAEKELAALDQFAALYPENRKTKNVIYKAAYLLYNHNHFEEAAVRFRTVIAMDPGSKEAEQAANLILDSFALLQDWPALRDNAKIFLDQPGLGSVEFKREVSQVYEQASMKAAGRGR